MVSIATDWQLHTCATQTICDICEVLHVGFGDVTVMPLVGGTISTVKLMVAITTDGQLQTRAGRNNGDNREVMQVGFGYTTVVLWV